MKEVTTRCKKMKNLAFQEGGMQEASKIHEMNSKMVCFLVSWASLFIDGEGAKISTWLGKKFWL